MCPPGAYNSASSVHVSDGLPSWKYLRSFDHLRGKSKRQCWQHTTCFEIWHGPDCCGICDRGPCYILQNALCVSCSFGVRTRVCLKGVSPEMVQAAFTYLLLLGCCGQQRMAEKGANYNCMSCCICFTLGGAVGAQACGAPILPCAVNVRRKLVKKFVPLRARRSRKRCAAITRDVSLLTPQCLFASSLSPSLGTASRRHAAAASSISSAALAPPSCRCSWR